MHDPLPTDDRGKVQITDVFLGVFVLVAIVVTAPVWYEFIDMGASQADPFTALVLRLIVPLLLIALVVSLGVSARRGGA